MTGVMGGQISITSWGWHEVDQLDGRGPRNERIWLVSDSRGSELEQTREVKRYLVMVPGVTDAHEAFLYICLIGEEGLPDQEA